MTIKPYFGDISPPSPPPQKAGKEQQKGKGRERLTASDALLNSEESPSQIFKAAQVPPPSFRLIEEQANLFNLARRLSEATKQTPLRPLKGEHQNDVYIPADLGVVFKPGKHAAALSKICYGIARLLGVADVLVPAKTGKASVIAGQDVDPDKHSDIDYVKLKRMDGKVILTDLSTAISVEAVQEKDGGWLCTTMDKKKVYLAQEGEYFKQVAKSTPLERQAKTDKFALVETLDDEDEHSAYYLVARKQVCEVSEKDGKDYTQLDGIIYELTSDDYGDVHLKRASIPQNKGKEPKDPKLAQSKFTRVYHEDDEVLVPSDALILVSIENQEDQFSFSHEEVSYKAVKKGETYSIESERKSKSTVQPLFDDEDFKKDGLLVLAETDEGDYYLIPKFLQSPVEVIESEEYVERNHQPYHIEPAGNYYHVVGRTVWGMVQAKVGDVFIRPTPQSLPIDIIQDKGKPQLKAFYDRIDMPSFIQAFIMTILLRPQDGKVSNLEESNVLFQAIIEEGGSQEKPLSKKQAAAVRKTVSFEELPTSLEQTKLRPVLIDLDETMPPNNKESVLPGFEGVHPLRCGLMGFPHARQPLNPEEKGLANSLLVNIIRNKEAIRTFLAPYSRAKSFDFSSENIKACDEVIDRIDSFIEKKQSASWTLEDLFFHVFPEYKEQWEILDKFNDPPEVKASLIGLESKEKLKARRKT